MGEEVVFVPVTALLSNDGFFFASACALSFSLAMDDVEMEAASKDALDLSLEDIAGCCVKMLYGFLRD